MLDINSNVRKGTAAPPDITELERDAVLEYYGKKTAKQLVKSIQISCITLLLCGVIYFMELNDLLYAPVLFFGIMMNILAIVKYNKINKLRKCVKQRAYSVRHQGAAGKQQQTENGYRNVVTLDDGTTAVCPVIDEYAKIIVGQSVRVVVIFDEKIAFPENKGRFYS